MPTGGQRASWRLFQMKPEVPKRRVCLLHGWSRHSARSKIPHHFTPGNRSQAPPDTVNAGTGLGLGYSQVSGIDAVADETNRPVAQEHIDATGVPALGRQHAVVLIAEITSFGADRRVRRQHGG